MTHAQLMKFWMDLPWPDIRRQASRALPKLAYIVLFVLLADTFAELTWKIIAPDSTSVATQTYSATSQHASSLDSRTNVSLRKVSQYHLFGEANKQTAVVSKIINAPDTRLKLTLKGIFAASDANNAIAIISGGNGDDKTYHIGDAVSGGAVLHAVYSDRVILKRNGQLETLRLPKPKLESSAITTSYPALRNELAVSESLSEDDNANTSAESAEAANGQSLREIRDTLLNDPAKVWQQVRINPVMEEGNVKGYTMVHNDQALMQSLNIRATDVIIEVNGQPLSDPATLYGLMNTLSQQQSLALTIERDGTQQSIELTF